MQPSTLLGLIRPLALVGLLALSALPGCEGTPPQYSDYSSVSEYRLTIGASPRSGRADGETAVTITVSLTGKSGEPAPSANVSLTTNAGKFGSGNTSATLAISNGTGVTTLVAPGSTATATVTASFEDVTATVQVPFT